MAVIRAVFKLEDQASTTMAKIATKAEALDAKLAALDYRVNKVKKNQRDFATSWYHNMERVKKATDDSHRDVTRKMQALGERLTKMSQHKYTMKVDADTTLAHKKLNRFADSARRTIIGKAMGEATKVDTAAATPAVILGSGLAGALASRSQIATTERARRLYNSLATAVEGFGNAVDRVGVNLGPFSSRLSTLPILLAAIGPPVIAAISAAMTTLSAAISAVGVAAVTAGGLLLAFGAGIASVAIPIVYAKKRIEDKQKEVEKYKKALDRANKAVSRTSQFTKDGTKVSSAYTKAVQRQKDAQNEYNKALNKLRGPEREAIKNVEELRKEWEKLVIQGPSGARAMSIVNTALLFARQQLPFVAEQFNRFSLVADRLFKRMLRNAPMFRKNLEQMTASWPARFEEMGMSIGHLTNGLTGILTAAGPTMEWMSKWILDSTKRFDEWANSLGGQNQIRKFFKEMQPVIEELVGLIYDVGAAIIDMATGSGRDDALYFLQEMRDIVRKTPDYVERMSMHFRKMWPNIKAFGASALDFFEDMAPLIDGVAAAVGAISSAFSKLPAPVVQSLVVFAVAMKSKNFADKVWKGIAAAWSSMAKSAAAISASGILSGFGGRERAINRRNFQTAAAGARGSAAAGAAGGVASLGAGAAAGVTTARAGAALAPAAAAAANPLVLGIAAAVAAAAVAALIAWKTNFGKIQEYTAGVWVRVKEHFSEIGKSISDMLNALGFKNKGFGDAMTKVFNGIKVVAAAVGSVVIRVFGGAFELAVITIRGAIETITYLIKQVHTGLDVIVKLIKGDFSGAWASVKQMAKNALDYMVAGVNRVKDAIIAIANAFGVKIGKQADTPTRSSPRSVNPGASSLMPQTTVPSGMYSNSDTRAGRPRQGDGLGVVVGGGMTSSIFDMIAGAGNTIDKILQDMPGGMMAQATAGALRNVYGAAVEKIRGSASVIASASGLLPGVGGFASALANAFGLTISSGMRRGAKTEFGNTSLHSLGRAVDLAGPAKQMQSLFSFLVGKPGIQELIYNGKAAYNGGPVVPFTGTDKHTDHVHVGFGDGVGQPSARRSGVAITFTGDVHISDGSSYQEFANRLASEIERAMKSSSGETTKEMIQ